MAGPDRCFWGILPPELVARTIDFLSPNEVACTCRLINKAIAKQFNGWISVRLSQPVPHHAFLRRWGDDRGFHGLTLARRQELVRLTARSGVIANLEVVAAVGCGLQKPIFNAAAEGGHLVVCVWLMTKGCPCNGQEVIRFAVRAGHTEVVRWALAQSPGVAGDALAAAAGAGQRALCEETLPLVLAAGQAWAISTATYEAAEGGHVELTEWLLGQLVKPAYITDGELLRSAARGFELPALQRLYHSRLGSSEASVLAEFIEAYGADLAAAALASHTHDWRAKLEWLEALGGRLDEHPFRHEGTNQDITKQGNAVERVALLRGRGLLDVGDCLLFAIDDSNLTVVRYLRSEGLLAGVLDGEVLRIAMEVGDVAVLAELLGAGGTVDLEGVYAAADSGHLHVLRWLEGPEAGLQAAAVLQAALQEGGILAECGARSGSLELMEWLWERGCPSNERVFTKAAGAGNMALLSRLVARGCPMSRDAYLEAGYNGDLATLRCLRKLDCPWGPGCTTFDLAVPNTSWRCCSLVVLRWLVAEGCPVDWQSARALVLAWIELKAKERCRPDDREADDVVAWIESHIPQA